MWRLVRTGSLAGLILLSCATTAMAAQYRLKTWTVENGLPQNVIRGIAQTPDGYLWIATLDGVARFDGMRFTIFNKSNTPGIESNRFGSMVGDAKRRPLAGQRRRQPYAVSSRLIPYLWS